MVPGWFIRFVKNIRCQQDSAYLATPDYRFHGEHYLALGRCYQEHWHLAIGLLRLTPEIAGDTLKETAEAANVWREGCFGIVCKTCGHNRFEEFTFDQVLPGRAIVYQRCQQCRGVTWLPMYWVYQEQPPKITPDEVLDARDLLEGNGGKPGIKTIEELNKILHPKEEA